MIFSDNIRVMALKFKNWLRSCSLRRKIILLTLSATIPIILSGMLNFCFNNRYMSEYFSIHEKLLSIDLIIGNTVKILPIVREYISDPLLAKHRTEFQTYRKQIQKLEAEILKRPGKIDDVHRFFLNDVALYLRMCENIMKAAEQGDPSVRSQYVKVVFQADNVKRSAVDLTMQELNYGNIVGKDINRRVWRIYTISLVFMLVWISLILIMISVLLKRVVANLKRLEDLSQQVTQGELNLSMVPIASNDEIGLLSAAFNEMVLSLKTAHREIDKRQCELQKVNNDLRAANLQLIKANTDLQDAQDQIIQSEKLASLGGLVAGVAHEINTPIGVSVSAASFLKDKNRDLVDKIESNKLSRKEFENYAATITETLDILLANLKRASELIGSFKMIAVDQTSEERREINLHDYIEDVILSLKHVLKKNAVEVDLDSEDNDLIINTYPGILAQVLTNLVMNSIIHGFENGKNCRIDVKINRKEDYLVLEYRDNGQGMNKEVLKRIFEPFYTTKRGQGGSGLGLFIVYNFVAKYLGGSIECKSKPGEGVLFLIKMPIEA
jgi:signal transduction histidine kinase